MLVWSCGNTTNISFSATHRRREIERSIKHLIIRDKGIDRSISKFKKNMQSSARVVIRDVLQRRPHRRRPTYVSRARDNDNDNAREIRRAVSGLCCHSRRQIRATFRKRALFRAILASCIMHDTLEKELFSNVSSLSLLTLSFSFYSYRNDHKLNDKFDINHCNQEH